MERDKTQELYPSIINPDIPNTPEEKLELYRRCMATVAVGGTVEGVLPLHVTQDGAVNLGRAIRAVEIPRSAY